MHPYRYSPLKRIKLSIYWSDIGEAGDGDVIFEFKAEIGVVVQWWGLTLVRRAYLYYFIKTHSKLDCYNGFHPR
jgi:hypothetical protein